MIGQSITNDGESRMHAGAFSTQHAARLVGLPRRQLDEWHRMGVFSPSIVRPGERRPYGRMYSFWDVVVARSLATLRDRLSPPQLRGVATWLTEHANYPVSSLRFFIDGEQVTFVDPDEWLAGSIQPLDQSNQLVTIEPIVRDIEHALRQMRQRDPADIGTITRRRNVLQNEWVVAGTRIPVWIIQDLWQSEYSVDDIVHEYPQLTVADVEAALQFALPAAG